MKPMRIPNVSRVVFLAVAALVFACDNSYQGQLVHRAEQPVTFLCQYMAYACGDYCPQIKPTASPIDTLDCSFLETGFMFRVPEGLSAPDQIDQLCVAGNRFEVVGHFYFVEIDGTKYLHPDFDLIAWRPLLPYRIWRFDLENEVGPAPQGTVTQWVTKPEGWRISPTKPEDPTSFRFTGKYDP